MTDNKIVKALEDLVKCNNNEIDCDNCSLSVFYPRCPEEIGELSLDLINRQKEEIERLKNAYKQVAWERDIFAEDMKEEIKKDCSYLMLDIKTIKAEAYKEFAERLKEKLFEPVETWLTSDVVREGDIDNLLKELVGEDK